jgi:predicted transcriptional regulator
MDELELNNGNEIRDFVSSKLKDLLDSFSILNVGNITKFVEPINHTLGVIEALAMFGMNEEVNSLPIEGDRGIIGIVHKKDLLKKKATFSDPPVERFIHPKTFSIDASENCEKVMSLILKREAEKLYDDFMIYERGKFFGIGTFADLSRNIAEIRNLDLGKARTMQEFLMARNTTKLPGIVA